MGNKLFLNDFHIKNNEITKINEKQIIKSVKSYLYFPRKNNFNLENFEPTYFVKFK